MADKKISELNAVTVAGDADVVAMVVGDETKKIAALDLKREVMRVVDHNIISISTTQTLNLSSTISVNALLVTNPGLTLTLQFPTSPIEGQITQFTTLTNTVTLVVGGGGSFSVNPSFAGAPTAGFKATYCYHESDDTYYLIS